MSADVEQPQVQEHEHEANGEVSADPIHMAEEVLEDTLKYVFDEYDADQDGLMTRKEFFTFLWELKKDTNHQLNEGQMMSCWKAVDVNNAGSVTLAEFGKGLEICYENLFYARENGVRPPDPVHVPPGASGQRMLINNEDIGSYNTVKFKKSVAVSIFEDLLKDEKDKKDREKEEKEKKQKERFASLENYTPTYRRERETRESSSTSDSTLAPPSTTHTSSYLSANSTPGLARASSINAGNAVARAPSVTAGSYLAKTANPTRPLSATSALQAKAQEREQKRLEAQKQMEKILAERHQAEKQRREEERKRKEEEERKKLEEELSTEPAWKQALRQKAATTGYK